MTDRRLTTLSNNLVHHSCKVRPGDNVLIEATDIPPEFVCELVKSVYDASGNPFVWNRSRRVSRGLLLGANEAQLNTMAEIDAMMMDRMQCYIGVRGGNNASENADVPAERMSQYMRVYSSRVHSKIRVPKTRWVVLRYPSEGMAQQADMSTAAFEDYYFDVCCLDYGRMSAAMDPLVALMERTDNVRLTARGTDLTFSIKGLPAIKCDGSVNIPDGEVFSAPVRDSVNGVITFNTPTQYNGFTFENVSLMFENGKVVRAEGNNEGLLNKILDTDEGARYTGEFAIGVNPYITRAMKDTLFDEKIAGSIHFTPGSCYDECDNGNKSAIHWDMVLIQTPEYGGGEIVFDGVTVRRDGRFVLPELFPLNPENLK